MPALRCLSLILLLATCFLFAIAPTYAAHGGVAGGGGQTFRAAGAMYTATTPAQLTGTLQYSLDPAGRAKLVVNYTNLSAVPSGTVLAVLADGVQIGTFTTSAQGGTLSLNTAPRLTLQSQISVTWDGAIVANGFFTLNI
jgi:hypothetical protein